MSEDIGNTQPQPPFEADSTQPLEPVRKPPRWSSIVMSIVGVIVLLALGIIGGVRSGIAERKATESAALGKQLTEQFQYALVDEQFGRYELAKERLESIIQHNPIFPGAQDELAKVLVKMTVPTAVPTVTITSTPDVRGEEGLFGTAQQLVATGDWANALAQLDQLRKEDPNYRPSQVDGMYYFVLRNYGMEMIQKQGNLEGGIYELTLAEHFAPLDSTANSLREGARAYIQASSFFGVDWKDSVQYFSQVASGWPALWDGTMTAGQRYHESLMRYGDQLWADKDACGAYAQYQAAIAIANLDAVATKNANQAFQTCYPPTATPTVTPTTIVVMPTDTGPAPAESATATP